MYSVGTEQEAKELLTLACQTNYLRQYVARELVQEQTLENLDKFSDRLHEMHELLKKHGRCRCAYTVPDAAVRKTKRTRRR